MQVTKLDTLAGIAVRYNVTVCFNSIVPLSGQPRHPHVLVPNSVRLWLVLFEIVHLYWRDPKSLFLSLSQVSDIKRANGLLSDTAMFARDSLVIPLRSMPVG